MSHSQPKVTYSLLEDYSKLDNHPSLLGMKMPDPSNSRIIMAEVDGEIVGYCMLLPIIHVEPIWVAEKYRGTSMAVRLFNKAISYLDDFRTSVAMCFSDTSIISSYLTRLKLRKLPYEVFVYDPLNNYPKGE